VTFSLHIVPFIYFFMWLWFKLFFSVHMFLSNILTAIFKKNIVEYFICPNTESHIRGKRIRELLLHCRPYSHLKFLRLIVIAICEHLSKRCHNSDSIRQCPQVASSDFHFADRDEHVRGRPSTDGWDTQVRCHLWPLRLQAQAGEASHVARSE